MCDANNAPKTREIFISYLLYPVQKSPVLQTMQNSVFECSIDLLLEKLTIVILYSTLSVLYRGAIWALHPPHSHTNEGLLNIPTSF